MNLQTKPLGSIGRILLEAGKLTEEQVSTITSHQDQRGGKFGEIAVKLGYITESDLKLFLARQFSFPITDRNSSSFSRDVVAAYDPYHPSLESLRDIRTELVIKFIDAGNRTLTLVEAQPNDGSDFVLINLAVLFAQLKMKVLLVDANLREPGLHKFFAFPTENPLGLSDMLAGRAGDALQPVVGLDDLFLLPAGTLAPNPQELLASPQFVELLDRFKSGFDIVFIRVPPAKASADAQLVASRSDGAVVVARKNVTFTKNLLSLNSVLKKVSCPVFGVVLND